jgi:hypothetical protein
VQRNYRTFLLFIYGTSVYIAWTFGVSLGSLFVKHSELVAAAAARPVQESEGLSSNLWLQTLSAYASCGGHMGTFGFPSMVPCISDLGEKWAQETGGSIEAQPPPAPGSCKTELQWSTNLMELKYVYICTAEHAMF